MVYFTSHALCYLLLYMVVVILFPVWGLSNVCMYMYVYVYSLDMDIQKIYNYNETNYKFD